jgi:omega-hydroxy-beta-dihydromenaquinone-9 sulfotransferase
MDIDVKPTTLMVKNTPLPGYSLPNFLRLLAQNHFHVSPRYLPRLTYSAALCGVITPFYIRERIKYDKKIKETKITKDPIFIIGHWRCGTTLLHNILSKDPQFGYFNTFQAYVPTIYLSAEKLFKPLVVSSLPKKRPMDNGDLDADLPQEDQYALASITPYSYYNGWCFPQNMQHYNDFICMTNQTQDTINHWRQAYLHLLKKATLYHHGKQLILKNQDNTGKIPLLLDMFPDAKFIHINRNPYDLYKSMMKFINRVLPRYCIQTPPPLEELEDRMMALYAQMTQKYLTDKSLIPEGNLVEIRYEDFYKQPLHTVKTLYDDLNLNGYKNAEQAFTTYLTTQQTIHDDHKHYTFTEPQLKKIENHWGFAVRHYNYKRPLEPLLTILESS